MDPSPTPTKQKASPMAAALPEEPHDDPASLVRAALVSKPWCRVICGRRFRGRFREFHGKPPLLGFVCQRPRTAQDRVFVPTSSFRPRHHGDRRNLKPMHSYHSRVLLHSAPSDSGDTLEDLFVWDPIIGKLRELPRWPRYLPSPRGQGNAAVLCAGALAESGSDSCNHLDCHHGPFIVVFVGNRSVRTFTCVYSSEADRWIDPVYTQQSYSAGFEKGNSVIIGSAVYFKTRGTPAILKYDLLTQEASPVHITLDQALLTQIKQRGELVAMEGDRVGFAFTISKSTKAKLGLQTKTKAKLYLCSRREHGRPDEDARSRVMDLDKLLPTESTWTHVAGLADTGAGGVIFIWSPGYGDKLFSLNLKSRRSKLV